MAIIRDNLIETNSLFLDSDWYNDGNEVIDETTEEGKALVEKILAIAPAYELVRDDDGKIIGAVEGFTPTTVVAAIDALAGVRIKDMGIDTNSYVQWENGLQVCWGEFSYELGATKWTIGNSISFPKEFADIPGLFLGYLRSGWRIIVSATSISETAFTPGAYNFDSAVTPWHMWYLAIGVWKP
jgi:hypothetical protein